MEGAQVGEIQAGGKADDEDAISSIGALMRRQPFQHQYSSVGVTIKAAHLHRQRTNCRRNFVKPVIGGIPCGSPP